MLCRYNQWSPPAQSNETSNGYFLERSHSARITLDKSYELCPEEEPEVGDPNGRGAGNNGVDDNENTGPSFTSAPDDATVLKSQVPGRFSLGNVPTRPSHAQIASPRATAPSNPIVSMPRSSPSQFGSLQPNRSQQPAAKTEGSGTGSSSSSSLSSGPTTNH